jgi:DNA-binding transcriptional regulator YdaS (Cro superfamily)
MENALPASVPPLNPSADNPATPLERAVRAVGGQSALGRLVGVSQATVWYWIRTGKSLQAEHVQTVSAATGIPPHELRPDIFQPPVERVTEAGQ